MKRIWFITAALLAAWSTGAWAMERFDIVTTEEMHAMLARRKAGEADFLLVNTLDELLAQFQTIPGSINVPWSRFKETKARLGDDKDRPIVVYCYGYR